MNKWIKICGALATAVVGVLLAYDRTKKGAFTTEQVIHTGDGNAEAEAPAETTEEETEEPTEETAEPEEDAAE